MELRYIINHVLSNSQTRDQKFYRFLNLITRVFTSKDSPDKATRTMLEEELEMALAEVLAEEAES